MPKRKIAVLTGSRAEYGLLYWLLYELQSDSSLTLQLIVTGMHLSREFGLTYQEIEADGFSIDAKVDMLVSSDSAVGIAKSIGLGVIGFADALANLKPDLLVVLGDRFEILAAVQTALILKIPVAHVHGGELSQGSLDDSIRHVITKMSHLHFPVAESYYNRILQLGESPAHIYSLGAPGLDHIARTRLLSREQLESELGVNFGAYNFLVTYHPVTLSKQMAKELLQLLAALEEFPDATIFFTKSNADEGGRFINDMLDEFVKKRADKRKIFTSLGISKYLSLASCVDVVVGNSSSGLIEIPLLAKPTVNIGSRQSGRLMASSIISCDETTAGIVYAINKALSSDFKKSLASIRTPYGSGDASRKIKEVLKMVDLDSLVLKKFNDLGGVK